MTTQILAGIGVLVLILQATTLIPAALTELLHASSRAVVAAHVLRATIIRSNRSSSEHAESVASQENSDGPRIDNEMGNCH